MVIKYLNLSCLTCSLFTPKLFVITQKEIHHMHSSNPTAPVPLTDSQLRPENTCGVPRQRAIPAAVAELETTLGRAKLRSLREQQESIRATLAKCSLSGHQAGHSATDDPSTKSGSGW